jgi:hypothetical protein
MFTIDAVVEATTKTSKQFTSQITDTAVRKHVEGLVDAQAAYTKAMYQHTVDLGKVALDAAKSFDASKLFAAKTK